MSNVSKNLWEELILEFDDTYIFHSPIWVKALEKTYKYRDATILYDLDGKEILIPMMKTKKYGFKFYDSMPLGYGGIFSYSELSFDNIKEVLTSFLGIDSLQFNLTIPPLSQLNIKEDKLIKEIKNKLNYTHILQLCETFEDIWKKKFKKKNRNAIRKSIKNKLEIVKGNSLNDFKEYYRIYEDASKKWGYNNPPYPFNFFKYLHKYGPSNINLSLAIKNNETIGGLITLSYSKTIFYWGSAYLDDYGQYNPTNLLLCNSIESACQEKYKYFNFGASGNLIGVRKFKESFGAQKVDYKNYNVQPNSLYAFIFNR